MKKILSMILVCMCLMAPSALAIDLYVDGVKLQTDTEPMIKNSRTMVPARFVAEALEADVKWDNNTRTVYVTTNPAVQPEPEPAGVFITPTGKRYHFDKECAGKNAIPSTLQIATGKGLTPCKTCAQ